MNKTTLHMIFENSEGTKSKVKINDVKDDVTSEEVAVLGNKIVNDNIMSIKKKRFVKYVGAELEKTNIETL